MAQEEAGAGYSARLAKAVAREVRRHRLRRGWSAQALSDRCAEVGMPIQRSVLANMESGRRSTVTVAELLVLAAALQVSPAELLFAVGYEEHAEPVPEESMDPLRAIHWLDGTRTLSGYPMAVKDNPVLAADWHRRMVASLRGSLESRSQFRREFMEASDERDRASEALAAVRQQLDQVRSRLVEQTDLPPGARFADRPSNHPEVQELVQEELRLVARTASLEQSVATARYMGDSIERAEGQLKAIGTRLAGLRRDMKERGWLVPELPKELVEFVKEVPWQDSLDFFADEGGV